MGKEIFLARAYAQDLETEELSLDEAKASSRKIREAGKAISNRSILAEIRERDTFSSQKKTRKERQKLEQASVRKGKQLTLFETESAIDVVSIDAKSADKNPLESELCTESGEPDMPEVLDYEQMREDYGW